MRVLVSVIILAASITAAAAKCGDFPDDKCDASGGFVGNAPSAKKPAREVVKSLPKTEAEWVDADRSKVKEYSDLIPNARMTKALSGTKLFDDRVYFHGSTTLTNGFGRKTDAYEAWAVSNTKDGSQIIIELTIEGAGFNDKRLLARVQERDCGTSKSGSAKYSRLFVLKKTSITKFDDEFVDAGKMPDPKCSFHVKGTFFKGSNFFGLRKIEEKD